MKRNDLIRFVLYLLTLAAILWHPVNRILAFERPSVPPAVFDFRMEIFDPYDPMRGRYVRLNPEFSVRLKNKNTNLFRNDQEIFAVLEKDEKGLAKFVDLVPKKPDGKKFLKVKYSWFQADYGKDPKNPKRNILLKTGQHRIRTPFERFYMNEKSAPAAEQMVREATADKKAVIRVKVYADGNAAIDSLLVDGKPVLGR